MVVMMASTLLCSALAQEAKAIMHSRQFNRPKHMVVAEYRDNAGAQLLIEKAYRQAVRVGYDGKFTSITLFKDQTYHQCLSH